MAYEFREATLEEYNEYILTVKNWNNNGTSNTR